ncbi:MAG: DUF86 domain-containing protein [Candidatus Melainabacteria bacterium]|jgi:uncharacterized protein with HEPN domain|nr:DUF86 domain-containing protein [Candidatus Melainabacteria bacterium]
MPKRYPDLLLADMLDCIATIETFVLPIGIDAVLTSRLHKDAIIRNLEVLGEAANQLPKNIKEKAPEVPWSQVISLRNRLIHEYHGVDWDILMPTILKDLPALKQQLLQLENIVE